MNKAILLVALVCFCAVISGCGETISGVGKDVNRMGRGVTTFFFRQP